MKTVRIIVSGERRKYSIQENNKGLICPYEPIICQEGFCQGCMIYLSRKSNLLLQQNKSRKTNEIT